MSLTTHSVFILLTVTFVHQYTGNNVEFFMATMLKRIFHIAGSDIYGSTMVIQEHHIAILYVHSLLCNIQLNLKADRKSYSDIKEG
jgi:hypothetical protein